MAREWGHEDIYMSVYVFDGHLFESCLRKLKGRHSLYYEWKMFGEEAGTNALTSHLKAMDWVIDIKCMSHVCSNAVSWAIRPFSPGETRKEAHCVIAALRRSSHDIQQQVDKLLYQFVAFREGGTDIGDAASL